MTIINVANVGTRIERLHRGRFAHLAITKARCGEPDFICDIGGQPCAGGVICPDAPPSSSVVPALLVRRSSESVGGSREPPTLVMPREGGASSTPRLLGSITSVSGILDRPPSPSRTMTSE